MRIAKISKRRALAVLLIGIVSSATSLAQTDNPIVAANLSRISHQMSSGIYERIINLGYIPSPVRYRRSEQLIAHNEFTLLFLRFYDFEPVLDGTAYVGRVFMSERYLEKDYNRKYISRACYKTDNDGFFMTCKLYFDERTLEYSLNIYPDYLLNICRKSRNPFKSSHFNKHICKTPAEHWASLKYVASLDDKHYDQFSDENDTTDIQQFLRSVPAGANLHHKPEKPGTSDPLPKITNQQKNMLREINLRKQIKCFRVAFSEKPGQNADVASSLALRFTKYTLSEDLLDNTTYTYSFTPYDSLIDAQLDDRGRQGVFVSRNPLYQSLTSSSVPDDNFIPGIVIPKEITLKFGLDEKLVNTSPENPRPAASTLKETVEATSKIQQRQDSTQLDQLKTKQQEYERQIQQLQQGDSKANARKLEKQEQELAQNQQAQVTLSKPYDQIRISSVSTSDTSWIYAGRQPVASYVKPLPKKRAVYEMPSSQHLRDTIPVQASATLWKKGNVKFGVRKGIAEKGSQWQIDTVAPIQQGKYQYVWLRIVPKRDTVSNQFMNGFFGKTSRSR